MKYASPVHASCHGTSSMSLVHVTAKARRPYVSSWNRGATSRWRLVERKCCRSATWATDIAQTYYTTLSKRQHSYLSVRLSVCHIQQVSPDQKVLEISNLVDIFSLKHLTDALIFGQKGQRSRSCGPVEVSNQCWFCGINTISNYWKRSYGSPEFCTIKK